MRRSSEPEIVQNYQTDESNTFFARDIEAVVFPENTEDVVQVLCEANATGTPVTISAGGTGLTGARVASCGGLIMTVELMRDAPSREGFEPLSASHQGIEYTLMVDRPGERAWCPPAVTLDAMEALLAPDLLFPPAPTERSAMLSGAVAANASGARSFMHGATRAWVEGLEVVLPTGETLTVERGEVRADGRVLSFTSDDGVEHRVELPSYEMPDTKNAAGLYAGDGMDLIDLFIGCEGIIGVVTGVLVRLTSRPMLFSDTAFFDSEEAALAHAERLRKAFDDGLPILSIEFYDERSLRFIDEHPQVRPDHKAAIFTELDGDDEDCVMALAEIIEESCPIDDWFADTDREREEQRDFRHILPEKVNVFLREHGTDKRCTDYAVPPEKLDEMMEAHHRAAEAFIEVTGRPERSVVLFGHIGDYHLHADFLPANEVEEDASMEQYIFLARSAIELGGTITAEHGVGKKTLPIDGREVPYLELMYGPEGLEEIARAKLALDPNAILNLGNMIPVQLLERCRE